MANSLTGHEQNVVNFGILIDRVSTFPNYNPPRTDLTIEAMAALKEQANTTNNAFATAQSQFKKSISSRSTLFDGFDSWVTRVANAIRISGAPAQSIAQAESIIRDLHGKRASDKLTDAELAAAKEKGEEVNQITVHNSTIDRKLENLGTLAAFLTDTPEYKPNEADLTLAAIKTKHASLKTANEAYSKADAALDAARIARDQVLYNNKPNLFDTVRDVKLYAKSAYGASSAQYKSISDITFTRPR
jgi:hypothetical protein